MLVVMLTDGAAGERHWASEYMCVVTVIIDSETDARTV